MAKVTKKQLVLKIYALLKALSVPNGCCININSIPDVAWVGYNQVMKRKHLGGVLYQNYRVKLYSKEVSADELLAISNELNEIYVNSNNQKQ